MQVTGDTERSTGAVPGRLTCQRRSVTIGGMDQVDVERRSIAGHGRLAVSPESADHTSPDGSPLRVYLALPAGNAPLTIHRAIERNSSILELGSGPGRLTRVLVALGHRVTAVDDSPEMLAHITGAQTICADLFNLATSQRFDVVLAASHLINTADPDKRHTLLRVCANHIGDSGHVIVERYQPGWLLTAGSSVGQIGPVSVEYQPGERHADRRSATVTYRLAEQHWTQHFEAIDIDNARLTEEAGAVGLQLVDTLDRHQTWVKLAATGQARAGRP